MGLLGVDLRFDPEAPINPQFQLLQQLKEHMPCGTDLLAAALRQRAHTCVRAQPYNHTIPANRTICPSNPGGATGIRTPDPLLAKQVL